MTNHDWQSETLLLPVDQTLAVQPSSTDVAERSIRDHSAVTLDRMLRKQTFPWRQAAECIAAVADVLATVHHRGGFHGAISAEVILLKEDGSPTLIELDSPIGKQDFAAENIGPFTAPERAQAQPRPVDARCDVYALGVVLYRLLCSRYPFRSTDRNELQREISEDAPQPPRQLSHGIPPELERLCLRLLSKNPGSRPSNGEDLARELRAVLMETEAFDQPADQSASTVVVRQLISPPRDNESLFVLIWDVSKVSSSRSRVETDRLQQLFREFVIRCSGNVLSQIDDATVARFPPVGERADGLPALLDYALTFLASIVPTDAPVGFEVYGAEPNTTATSGLSTIPFQGLKRVALRVQGSVSEAGLELSPPTFELLRRWLPCREISEEDFEIRVGGSQDARCLVVRKSAIAAEVIPLPLMGRASQLAMLKARWEQACEGMGQIVLLIGDEGVGKTRLLQELQDEVAMTPEKSRWIHWSCQPGLSGQSLHPAIEFLRSACGFSSESDALERLSGFLSQWNAATPETLAVFATLLQLPITAQRADVERLTATQRRDLLQQTLLDWLKSVATAAPVVFVVEDLQWVDPATLTLLHKLVDQGLNERVLTILTFRPEFETPWGSRAHQSQVALSRLTKRHATSLFSSITGVVDPQPSLVEELIAVSEGIPLFVEEFARLQQLFSGRKP